MAKSASFLLVGDSTDEYGLRMLRDTLSELGVVHVTGEERLICRLGEQLYDGVIVDAGAVVRAAAVVASIRECCPYTPVVVLSASPHWRVARDVFRAGATDYLPKSRQWEILDSFRNTLE